MKEKIPEVKKIPEFTEEDAKKHWNGEGGFTEKDAEKAKKDVKVLSKGSKLSPEEATATGTRVSKEEKGFKTLEGVEEAEYNPRHQE